MSIKYETEEHEGYLGIPGKMTFQRFTKMGTAAIEIKPGNTAKDAPWC
jgi:hypothetical protein